MGHLDLQRQGIKSTTPVKTQAHDDPTDSEASDDEEVAHNTLYTDATGDMPTTSAGGFKFVIIATYHGYIHVEPAKSHETDELIQVMKRVYQFYGQHKQEITKHVMDNEVTNSMRDYIKSRTPSVELQLVPPNNHRANTAERAIRTWQRSFISTMATADKGCPPYLWDEAIPQIELAMNLLKPYKKNNMVSAYEGVNGKTYDFAAHPIAPFGTKVLALTTAADRATMEPHGVVPRSQRRTLPSLQGLHPIHEAKADYGLMRVVPSYSQDARITTSSDVRQIDK
jgi:hypothetical protein